MMRFSILLDGATGRHRRPAAHLRRRAAAACSGCAALLALALLPLPARAQEPASAAGALHLHGFSLTGTSFSEKPFFGGNSGRLWEPVGDFGVMQGVSLELGYAAGQFGGGVALELASGPVGEQDAVGLGVALLAHWRPHAAVFGSWRPRFTVGYVRQAYGGVDYATGEFPGAILRLPDDILAPPGHATLIGNMGRIGFALGHATSLDWLAAWAGIDTDVARFHEVDFDGGSYELRDPGWTVVPRLSISVRLDPGAAFGLRRTGAGARRWSSPPPLD